MATTPAAEVAWSYLQLCQRAAVEAGVANASLVPTPATVAGASGELLRVCQNVADAWRELQGIKHWSWMWENPTLTVPAGLSKLATGIPPDRWDKDSVIRSPVTSDGSWLDYVPWQDFRTLYTRIVAGNSISAWTIDPANNFCINGLAPTGGVVVSVERWANPTALLLDTDVPGLPADLQMLLVYMAVRKYAGYDEAGTQRTVAMDEERTLRRALCARCLPEYQLGGSLTENY